MKIYFIESGEVEIVSVGSVELGFEAHPKSSPGVSSVAASAAAAIQSRDTAGGNNIDVADVNVVRVNKVQAGGAFGEADFLLGKNQISYLLLSLKTIILLTFLLLSLQRILKTLNYN